MKLSRWELLFTQGAIIRLLWIIVAVVELVFIDGVHAQIIHISGDEESCSEKPPDCDLFCRYGYRKRLNDKCVCLCYDPCKGKICGRDETCIVKSSGNQFIGQCVRQIGGASKPGRCPKLQQGFCLQECDRDADCIGDRKCCSNDCGRICASPVSAREKVGRCPQPTAIPVQTCRSECREDSECTGVQKCCTNGCANICSFPQHTTECVHLRAAVERLPTHTLAHGYVPSCRADGSFKPVQCDQRFCWCVNRDGTETFGTKIRVVAAQTPNCNAPRICPSGVSQCPNRCPHGFQTGPAGCPLPNCLCRDICAGVQCPNSYETCQLVEPDCQNPPCTPVPRCLLNPCPRGKPMTLPENRVTALCTNTPECGPSHWCHLIGYSGFGFCCAAPPSAIRPGSCPGVQPGAGGNCAVGECRVDSDCSQDHKCCFNGCGLSCMAVRGVGPPVKPGECPRVTRNPFDQCLTLCNHDGDCPNQEKCCQVGCSVRCERPQTQIGAGISGSESAIVSAPNSISRSLDKKLGDCPLVPAGRSTTTGNAGCRSTCQSDRGCGGARKCCSNGCGGSTCVYPAIATACIHARISSEILFGNRAVWIPKCTSDGDFEPVQCSVTGSPCWCTDKAGRELGGTRDAGTPDCKNPVSKCPTESCGLRCPFGLQIDDRGCEICSCRNPCNEIQCQRPHEICVILAVECYDPTNCPSQPRCVANICPNGIPFRDQISGLLFQCDSEKPCPTSFWCHNVGFDGQGMCCPAPEVNINAGQCPAVTPQFSNTIEGLCALQCRSDGECTAGQKCCYNGCGLSCTPLTGSSGSSSVNPPSRVIVVPKNTINTITNPAVQQLIPSSSVTDDGFTKPGSCPIYDRNRPNTIGCPTGIIHI